MRRPRFVCALVLLLLAASRLPADPIGPPPIQDQVAQVRNLVANADCVVIGKVKLIEDKTVGTGTTQYEAYKTVHKVAVITVDEAFMGPKELREVRVAFKAVNNPQFMHTELTAGQEGCFALKRHYEHDFYIVHWSTKKADPNYERDLAQARRTGRCLADTLAGLKSRDAEDRLVTAAALIQRYRGTGFVPAPIGKVVKYEPITPEESKLILRALADADWTPNPNSTSPAAFPLFSRLGVTVNDGFKVTPGTPYYTAAKSWVQENADTYVIKRYVLEDAPKK